MLRRLREWLWPKRTTPLGQAMAQGLSCYCDVQEAIAALEPFAAMLDAMEVAREEQGCDPPTDGELIACFWPKKKRHEIRARDLRRAREALAKLKAWGERPWRGVCRLDYEYPTLFRVVIDTANLPQWEPHLTFNPRWIEEEAGNEPVPILEALEELRAAGGDAWDGVEDVEAYLAEEE